MIKAKLLLPFVGHFHRKRQLDGASRESTRVARG